MAKKEKLSKEEKKHKKAAKWFTTLRRAEPIVYRPFFPYKKYGHTEFFDDRAYIFVGNHLTELDVVFPAVSTHRMIHFMAKSKLFKRGAMKWFVNKCECIPVNRDGTDVRAVMLAMKYLKKGEHVVIFPEGTRNKSKEMFLPFKGGAAAIAIKTKTPIAPFVQIRKVRPFRKAHVLFGEPFEFSDYYDKRLTEEDIEKCEQMLLEKMTELYNQLVEMRSKKRKKK